MSEAVVSRVREPPFKAPAELSNNHLLALLSASGRERLAPHLTLCRLEPGIILQREDMVVEHAYFPVSGLISSALVMPEGIEVVSALVGSDGAACSEVAPPPGRALTRATVRLAGAAWRVPFAVWRQVADHDGQREVLACYHAFRLFESQQNAACNLLHDVESRLCRWLLQVHDRVGRSLIPMTHAELATLTGVRRTTITLIAGGLEAAGIIHNRRGTIDIIDRFALEATACECYGRISARQAAFQLEFEGGLTGGISAERICGSG
jgi:CRP-like cAMP-binding protein